MKRIRICAALLLASAVAGLAAPRPAPALAPPSLGLGGSDTSGLGVSGLASGANPILGAGGNLASNAATTLILGGIGTWVLGGASYVLHETGRILAETTSPRLTSTWFSATYWRVAGIAALLTLPFLFAAAVQALLASDLTLLLRAALGYLPLAMLAVSVAAPVTMLLLAAFDQLAAIVASAAGHQSTHFLEAAGGSIAGITSASGSPFIAFFAGLLTVSVAVWLWLELLIRDAAVYVVVLMLPLMFAAFVWPARRVWAIRTVELLLALIVSKFVIVAVLSLGGVALGQGVTHGISGIFAGGVLLILGALAPWALLRLLPMTEVASAAAGSLRSSARAAYPALQRADARASEAQDWVSKMADMKRSADDAGRERDPSDDRPHTRVPELARRLRSQARNGNGLGPETEDGPPAAVASAHEADGRPGTAAAPATSMTASADEAMTPSAEETGTSSRDAAASSRPSRPPAPETPTASSRAGTDPDPLPGLPVKTIDGRSLRLTDPQKLVPRDATPDPDPDALPELGDPTPPAQPRTEGEL